jgi:hypothetical protein
MSTVQTTLNETEVKELLKQAVAEVLQEQQDFLYEVFLEALEDIALIQAIQQGENPATVSRAAVSQVLEGVCIS